MKSRFFTAFERVLTVGTDLAPDKEYPWIRNANALGLVMLGLSIVYFVAFYLANIGDVVLLPVTVLVNSLVYYLLAFYGYHKAARHLLVGTVCTTTFFSVLLLGTDNNLKYCFFLLATFPVLIFKSSDYKHWMPGVTVAILAPVFFNLNLIQTGYFPLNDTGKWIIDLTCIITISSWLAYFTYRNVFKMDKMHEELTSKIGGLVREIKVYKQRFKNIAKKHVKLNEKSIDLETENLILRNEVSDYLKKIEHISKSIASLDEMSDEEKNRLNEALKSLSNQMNMNVLDTDKKQVEHINTQYIIEDIITELKRNLPEVNCDFSLQDLPVIEAIWEDFNVLMTNLLNDCIKRAKFSEKRLVTVLCKEKSEEYEFAVLDNHPQKTANDEEANQATSVLTKKRTGSVILKPSNISICNKIVSHYGGKLWSTYDPEKGYVVYFTIKRQVI